MPSPASSRTLQVRRIGGRHVPGRGNHFVGAVETRAVLAICASAGTRRPLWTITTGKALSQTDQHRNPHQRSNKSNRYGNDGCGQNVSHRFLSLRYARVGFSRSPD